MASPDDNLDLHIPDGMPENLFELEPKVHINLWLDDSPASDEIVTSCLELELPIEVVLHVEGIRPSAWDRYLDFELLDLFAGEYFPAASLTVGEHTTRSYVTGWLIGHRVLAEAIEIKKHREGLPPPERTDGGWAV